MNNTTSDNPDDFSPDLTGYGYYTFGISIGVVLVFAFITFALYYFSRRNSINESQAGQGSSRGFHLRTIVMGDSSLSRRAGVDDTTLRSYPVLLYSEAKLEGMGDSEDSGSRTSCSICLGDYKESEWLRVLPECGHLFHRKCIDVWLRTNSSCPLCRNSPLPTPVSSPLDQVAPLARTRG